MAIWEKKLRSRIALAIAASLKLLSVRKSPLYPRKLKLWLFRGLFLSVLSYSIDCLKLTMEQEKRITAFKNNGLCWILRISENDHVSNGKIRTYRGQTAIASAVRQRRRRHFGHILCVPDQKLQKKCSPSDNQRAPVTKEEQRTLHGVQCMNFAEEPFRRFSSHSGRTSF